MPKVLQLVSGGAKGRTQAVLLQSPGPSPLFSMTWKKARHIQYIVMERVAELDRGPALKRLILWLPSCRYLLINLCNALRVGNGERRRLAGTSYEKAKCG